MADTRINNQILKNHISQNQSDNSKDIIYQNEILKKQNEELKMKVEKLEEERDAETKKSLHCQSENISNRELILELRTSQSKLTSGLEICKNTDADLLISDKELEECNHELEAEKKKKYQCESEKKICQEEIISFARINSKLESETAEHVKDNNTTTTIATTSQTKTLETTTVAIPTSVSSTTTSTAPVTTTTPSMPWTTNLRLSYTVLVLNSRMSQNKPLTVDFNGKNHSDIPTQRTLSKKTIEGAHIKILTISGSPADHSDFHFWYYGNVDDDLIFEYGQGTGAYAGCGAILMGEMWYFGGSFQKRQV